MKAARLVLVLALGAAGVGCSEKGLMGVELGAPVETAKAALKPKVGKGTWETRGDRQVYTAVAGVPTEAVLDVKDGKVAGVRLVFEDEPMRSAGIVPTTFKFDLKKKQMPEGAKGPLEFATTRAFATPDIVYTVLDEGEHYEVGRYDLTALDATVESCDDVGGLLGRIEAGVAKDLGADGARMGAERDDAIRRLLVLTAAAELSCPESSGVLTTAGDFFVASGRYNGAIERYKKALKVDRDWDGREAADAQGGLGTVAARYKRFEEASQRFHLALETASTPAKKAMWARRYADRLDDALQFGEAAKYYEAYLANVDGADAADTQRVYARLARAWIETEKGCEPAKKAVEKGMAVEGTPDRARAEMLAAKAFTTIACDPKHKKDGMKDLEAAVKLDPLMAAEWARLVSYYDREANDATVLDLMLDQGWIDRDQLKNAREYQRLVRDQVR